jgi:ABC-type uncharacterized transport system substrate-binding protein
MESKRPSATPERGTNRFAAGLILLAIHWWLALLPIARPVAAPSSVCADAPVVLVHPQVRSRDEHVIAQIVRGLRERTHVAVGVCSIEELPGSTLDSEGKAVVAVGENASAAATLIYNRAPVVPILVRQLPKETGSGISLFLDPNLYIQQLRALSPDVNVVTLIHRDDVPQSFIDTVRAAAAAHRLRFEAIGVATLRDAAVVVETVVRQAGPQDGIWLQGRVIGMNADILLPKIVASSWERKVPVFTDEADYVARGLLFAVTHDYSDLGRSVADLIDSARQGIRYANGVKTVLNGRTATAIGIFLPTSPVKEFNDSDE